jgi:hypothetical protein
LKVVVEGGYGGDVVVMEVVEAFGYGGSWLEERESGKKKLVRWERKWGENNYEFW